VTGNVTALVQDVTKTGVVRVAVVAADTVAGEVSGDSGVSATIDVAVAFNHAADETVGSVGISSSSAVAQTGGAGTSGGGAGGADEDGVVGQEVIGTEDFETISAVTSGVKTSSSATLTGRTAGELVVEAGAVELHSGTDLFQVAGAVDATGTFTGLLQSGEQHTSEDRDDRDDDEELDKSESTTFLHFFNPFDCFLLMTSASDFVSVQQCSSLTVPNYSKKIVTCKTCYDFFLFFFKKFQNTKLSFF
jgi:hypothetical protein